MKAIKEENTETILQAMQTEQMACKSELKSN